MVAPANERFEEIQIEPSPRSMPMLLRAARESGLSVDAVKRPAMLLVAL